TRGFQDLAVDVVEPTVVAAADAAPLHHAELQRCAPVRAMELEQTDLASPVAEEDQVLAQNAHPFGKVLELGGQPDRVPEAPKVLTAGCARADLGELEIGLWNLAVKVAAIGLGDRRVRHRCSPV